MDFCSSLDDLSSFSTATHTTSTTPARYAIRQALDQEYQKYLLRQNTEARQARYHAGGGSTSDFNIDPSIAEDVTAPTAMQGKPAPAAAAIKRDFFGRPIIESVPSLSREGSEMQGRGPKGVEGNGKGERGKVWVSFHEGFSNAVRKPITLEELMRGF